MDVEKKRFRKMFPHLAQELESVKCGTKINSVRSDSTTGEKAVSRRFTDYTPDVIDFLRRCDKVEQAEEIIGYLEKREEISFEYARKLRKQLKEKGVRSFGSKKEDDYYLKQHDFKPEKEKRKTKG
jgi:hypothetical protein